MNRLQHKIAVITGATGGIGYAAARLFADEGAQVVLVDLRQADLDAAVAVIGPERAMGVAADVTDPVRVEAYVRAAMAKHGRIDVFFNNAGIEGAIAPIQDYPLEVFDQVMAVNVRGVWLGLKYVIPEMARGGGGSIVITSSFAGLHGAPKMSAYVAAKHAVVGIMKVAALEGAPKKIRVNTINPAPIATRMIASIEQGYAPGATDVVKKKMENAVPLRRYGTPEEVARLALFLASDESTYITGSTYSVDGGMSAS